MEFRASLPEFKRAVETHLTPEDHAAFLQATGSSVTQLLNDPLWSSVNNSMLRRFMSHERLVPHPLNRRGLHPLRALLSERVMDYVRKKRGSPSHPLFEQFQRDGILVIPDAQNISRSLKTLLSAHDEYVLKILHMVSGYKKLGGSQFGPYKTIKYTAVDSQFYMHVDTYMPSWKVFVFKQVAANQGPFHYVYGSHRNTAGKMRWLYDRSSHFVDEAEMKRKYPPASEDTGGAFADETHGFIPSLRWDKYNPDGGAQPEGLSRYGLPEPTAVTSTSPMTLVVVDTSGFHYRGWAPVGNRRTQARFAGRGGGCGGCIARKNVFFCEPLPSGC